MDEVTKSRFILILSILTIIFLLLWGGARRDLGRQARLAADKAALSMDLEDKNMKLEKEKATLAEELKNVQAQLNEEKANHELTKKTLSQEQVAEQALKVELERVTRLKETLEKDSKEPSGNKKS